MRDIEYTNIYKLLEDVVHSLKTNGGYCWFEYVTPSVIALNINNFGSTFVKESRLMNMNDIPANSTFLKIIDSLSSRKKFIDLLNRQSKDFEKEMSEEEIIASLSEECPTIKFK